MTDKRTAIPNIYLWIAAILLVFLGIVFYFLGPQYFSNQTPSEPESESTGVLQLKQVDYVQHFASPKYGDTYTVKQSLSFLGMDVLRLEHKQYPQQFLIVKGIGREAVNELFNPQIDPNFIEPIANQVLKLKLPEKRVQLDIQSVAVTEEGHIQGVPFKEANIQFQLNTEDEPRRYQGTMVRAKLSPNNDQHELLLISFTQDDKAHRRDLLEALLRQM